MAAHLLQTLFYVLMRGCRKLEFYTKNNCKFSVEFWRFSTHIMHFDGKVMNNKRC